MIICFYVMESAVYHIIDYHVIQRNQNQKLIFPNLIEHLELLFMFLIVIYY